MKSSVPDMCLDEMDDMCVAVLTLEALEELRRSSKTSNVVEVRNAISTCSQLNSNDERTVSFIQWGQEVEKQMVMLESSCLEILQRPDKVGLQKVHLACQSYKYFSPAARKVSSTTNTISVLDNSALEAVRTLDKVSSDVVDGACHVASVQFSPLSEILTGELYSPKFSPSKNNFPTLPFFDLEPKAS